MSGEDATPPDDEGTGAAGEDPGEGTDTARRTGDRILSVEDLRAGYGETEVLRGVSFDVLDGEVAALVGRNGVGKTTTLRAITGAIPTRSGSIQFRGESITGEDSVATAKRGIGLVPEERRIFPGLTVQENLRMGQLGGSETAHRRDVEDVLETFGNLRERRNNRGANLSGGEQQMLAIARALVAGADLLLLDEPTEGLAPLIVESVEDVIREVNDEGISVLLVEQNVAVALDLADHVFVLDRGRIVYSGAADRLEEDSEVLDRHLGVSM